MPEPILTLRVLGGLSLSGPAGAISGRATQRRRLALLAVLAAARGRPVSRDKLIGLLWSDSDSESARHLLADSIYILRESLGKEAIPGSGDDVWLDTTRIDSDVLQFWTALEGGQRETAAGIYAAGGPFLDGVHISNAAEFERWADSLRAQVEQAYRVALREIADDAASHGRYADAVTWWRQLVTHDRLSSGAALGLMRALDAAGDRAGALEFARIHENIVRNELESAPDDAVMNYIAELQTRELPHARPVKPTPPVKPAPLEPPTPPEQPAPEITAVAPIEATSPRRSFATVAIGLAVLVVVIAIATVAYSSSPGRRGAAPAPSIAVLPIVNLGGADNESFSDGLTEELTDALAKTGLQVTASTSAFVFKSHRTDVRAIADSLHVTNVLESDVQRIGRRVRLHVRLVNAASGATLWANTYDRDVLDVFAVQAEIGHNVAEELNARLVTRADGGPVSTPHTSNAAAYDQYLLGRHQRELRTLAGFGSAIQYFRRAVALDSGYAAAYAALGEVTSLFAGQGNRPLAEVRALIEEAEAAASKAVALDDALPEAHTALAMVRLGGRTNLAQSEAELKRALALKPSDRRTHEDLALVYDWSDQPELAIAEARQAIVLDPLSMTAVRELARAEFAAHNYDEALRDIERARTLGEPVRSAPLIAAEILARKKLYPQALASLQTAKESWPVALLGHTLAEAGQREQAMNILSQLTARWRSGELGAFPVAVVYAGLGDFDRTFEWLDKSFDDLSIHAIIMDPTFDALRADRRFERVKRRLGIQKR